MTNDRQRRVNEVRLDANDRSRLTAEHHREEWTAEEVAILEGCWGEVPLEEIAEALGRTIEACRQFHYELGQRMIDRARKATREAEIASRSQSVWMRGFTSLDEMEKYYGER